MSRVGRFWLLIVTLVALGGCGSSVAPTASPPAVPRLDDAAAVVGARLDALGVAGASARVEAGAVVVDGVPGDQRAAVIAILRRPGVIEFVPVPADAEPPAEGDAIPGTWPRLFGGEAIDPAGAGVGVDQAGLRTINLSLTAAGAERFATWTRSHVGESFAVVADGVVLMAPVVNEEIAGGHVQISRGTAGGFSADDATSLVALIRSGPLPAEFVAAGAPIR